MTRSSWRDTGKTLYFSTQIQVTRMQRLTSNPSNLLHQYYRLFGMHM